jgi:hypothetical protein
MTKRLLMVLAGLFLSIGMAMAQKQISGTVISVDDGQPIVGATITVPGTNVGTVTDINGEFSMTLPQGKSDIRVSYLGMVEQTLPGKQNMKYSWYGFNQCRQRAVVRYRWNSYDFW